MPDEAEISVKFIAVIQRYTNIFTPNHAFKITRTENVKGYMDMLAYDVLRYDQRAMFSLYYKLNILRLFYKAANNDSLPKPLKELIHTVICSKGKKFLLYHDLTCFLWKIHINIGDLFYGTWSYTMSNRKVIQAFTSLESMLISI